MRRLVDVDELIKYFDEDLEGYDNREYILQMLDAKGRIERVKAIPIEWIKNYLIPFQVHHDSLSEDSKENDGAGWVIDVLETMMREWEKENEQANRR